MPQYGYRPYFLIIIPALTALKDGTGVAQQDYFTGFIGQMGTQFDAFGHAILFNYGWAVYWNNPQKYNDARFFVGENQGSPGIGVEVARWAVDKKASMVGADSCCVTIQPPTRPELGNVPHELLFGGVLMLENMDLRELARDRVYEFLYLNLTERIRGATGSPVRPIAIR